MWELIPNIPKFHIPFKFSSKAFLTKGKVVIQAVFREQ